MKNGQVSHGIEHNVRLKTFFGSRDIEIEQRLHAINATVHSLNIFSSARRTFHSTTQVSPALNNFSRFPLPNNSSDLSACPFINSSYVGFWMLRKTPRGTG